MKKKYFIVIFLLLIPITSMAMTAKIKDEPKKVYEVLQGDTDGIVEKNQLAVKIEYSSEHVDVNVSSDIHIVLKTKIDSGLLKVDIYPLDEELQGLEKYKDEFYLSSSNQEFEIDLETFSSKEGTFYINVAVSIENQGIKVLAIPVYIGDSSKKSIQNILSKSENSEHLHIMKAEEEIK